MCESLSKQSNFSNMVRQLCILERKTGKCEYENKMKPVLAPQVTTKNCNVIECDTKNKHMLFNLSLIIYDNISKNFTDSSTVL